MSIPVCEKYRRWAGRRILTWISLENFIRKLGPWWISLKNLALGPQTKFRQHFHSLHGRNATGSKTTFLILSYPDKSQDHFETRHVIDPSVTSSMNWVRGFWATYFQLHLCRRERNWAVLASPRREECDPFSESLCIGEPWSSFIDLVRWIKTLLPPLAPLTWGGTLYLLWVSLSLSHTHTHTHTNTHIVELPIMSEFVYWRSKDNACV
jgi:hypothetical protein